MVRRGLFVGWMLYGALWLAEPAAAQLAPEIGYVYPAGAPAGATVDVKIGGYDWTPDMQMFVHDPRIKLEIVGPPSEVLVPPPPYWFGAKGRGPAWPLPREFPARLTIPSDAPPGIVRFQVANANGASPVGLIHVGSTPEVVEDANRKGPQPLSQLPVTVNGQIRLIEEVDHYEFATSQAGPVTIELTARRLESPLHALIRVRDEQGKLVVDVADTEGTDLATTFVARAGEKYTLSVHDLDYAGDRSYVYRLTIAPSTRIKAAYPAGGTRGQVQKIEFVGLGLATGADQIESVVRDVTVPATSASTFLYAVDTPNGPSRLTTLVISDFPEQAETAGATETAISQLPAAVTGTIETPFGTDRYIVTLKKGETWRIEAQASEIGSPLDPELSLLGPDGKQLMTSDDAPGTTSAALVVPIAADGTHAIAVTDRSGKSGSRSANYRLVVQPQREDFSLTCPSQLSVILGEKGKLAIKAARAGGFKGAIQLALAGLPPGVTAPPDLAIPEGKNDLAIELTCDANAAAAASLVTISATGTVAGQTVTSSASPLLIATVMKPRIKITPEGLDDVRKVHRGSTFLAPLLIERLEGYQGEIILEMTAKQQRHRQGLASPEFLVAADTTRVEYRIFVPEWMETTKTSRMILNGVVKVADPQGNVRTLVQKMQLRIGILPEGALLKTVAASGELMAKPGEELRIPLRISRASELREPLQIELIADAAQTGIVSAEPITLAPDQQQATLAVKFANDPRANGEQVLRIRATALQSAKWPVISETTLSVTVGSGQ